MEQRNQAYYAKFPEDIERVKRIVEYLSANDITIPSGKLTPERFQQLGILFGMHGKHLDKFRSNDISNIAKVVSISFMVISSSPEEI